MTKGPGGGVTVRMWGVDHRVPALVPAAHQGRPAHAALVASVCPSAASTVPNLAKEAVTGDVAETFTREARSLVMPMIEKRIAGIIK